MQKLTDGKSTMDIQTLDWAQLKILALAAAFGSVLGVEREIGGKPAGIRTHMFVCAGSALMMILGQEIIEQFQKQELAGALQSDPIRILQAIVVGISFLGAGTIFHDKQGVVGLTTAASIFLTAGIGAAVAVDRVAFAALITGFATLSLVVIGWLEGYVERWRKRRDKRSSGQIEQS